MRWDPLRSPPTPPESDGAPHPSSDSHRTTCPAWSPQTAVPSPRERIRDLDPKGRSLFPPSGQRESPWHSHGSRRTVTHLLIAMNHLECWSRRFRHDAMCASVGRIPSCAAADGRRVPSRGRNSGVRAFRSGWYARADSWGARRSWRSGRCGKRAAVRRAGCLFGPSRASRSASSRSGAVECSWRKAARGICAAQMFRSCGHRAPGKAESGRRLSRASRQI